MSRIILIVSSFLLLSSCLSMFSEITVRNQINRIISNNEKITSITEIKGIEELLILDVLIEDKKRLLITRISTANLNRPFNIQLIGDLYIQAVYIPYQTDMLITGVKGIPVDIINKQIGMNINNVYDAIIYYDEIERFIRSLSNMRNVYEILKEKENISSIEGFRWVDIVNPIKYDFNTWFIRVIDRNDFPEYYIFPILDEGYDYEERRLYIR